MEYQIVVTYDERIVNEAAKRFWIRLVSRKLVLGVFFLVVACGLWFLGGSKTWYTATLIALALVFIFIAIALFFVTRRRSLRIFREMESPTASWRFADECFSVKSDVASAEFKWHIVKKLLCFDEVWLLLYANETYSTLPVADIPEDVRKFLVEKVRASGGTVT